LGVQIFKGVAKLWYNITCFCIFYLVFVYHVKTYFSMILMKFKIIMI
jgi:hypothetical protein